MHVYGLPQSQRSPYSCTIFPVFVDKKPQSQKSPYSCTIFPVFVDKKALCTQQKQTMNLLLNSDSISSSSRAFSDHSDWQRTL